MANYKNMKRILLVEDCEEIQIVVRGCLGNDYQLTCTSQASEALLLVESLKFDLIIIDIVLGEGNGFQLCTALRNQSSTSGIPIIFLSSKSDIKDKLMGFSLGGNDYMVKPFEPLELRARIEAKLNELDRKAEYVQKFDLKINLPFQKAYLVSPDGEKELDLTPNEFKLLYYLVSREGHVFSREDLLGAIWRDKENVSDRTVDVHIYNLRKKLLGRAHYIKSVFGEGYRFETQTNP